jgi:hypothetical protein
MKACFIMGLAPLLLGAGCAGTQVPVTQQMADVQSANRTATELGAQHDPKAQLHLKLSAEGIGDAKKALNEGDDASAGRLLTRAKADAELAVALTRESNAKTAAGKALNESNAQGVPTPKSGESL